MLCKRFTKLTSLALVAVALFASSSQAEDQLEYPTYFANANDISIAYQEFGDKNNEVLVLVMGLGGQLIHWNDDFVLSLVEAGYRVIRFDNRDVGWSRKIYDGGEPNLLTGIKFKLGMSLGAPYHLNDMADDVIGLMDYLDIQQAHIMGVSMGGMIAQAAVGNYPNRFKTLTSIMSSTNDRDLPEGTLTVEPRPDDLSRDEAINLTVDFWKKLDAGRSVRSEQEWFDHVARAYDRMYYPPGFARQLWAILDSPDRVEMLKSIKHPSLVIHGSADALIPPEHGEHTAEQLENSKYVLIEGMGHSLDEASRAVILNELISLMDNN